VGKDFWSGLIKWLKKTLIDKGTIVKEDLSLFCTVDSPNEVLRVIQKFYRRKK